MVISYSRAFNSVVTSHKSTSNAGDCGSIPGLGRSSGGGLPTPVFVPGKSHGQRSLAGYSPWGSKELDITEQLSLHFSQKCSKTNYSEDIYFQ